MMSLQAYHACQHRNMGDWPGHNYLAYAALLPLLTLEVQSFALLAYALLSCAEGTEVLGCLRNDLHRKEFLSVQEAQMNACSASHIEYRYPDKCIVRYIAGRTFPNRPITILPAGFPSISTSKNT